MKNLFSKIDMPAMSGSQTSNAGYSTDRFGSNVLKGVSGIGFARDFTFTGLKGRAKEFFGRK